MIDAASIGPVIECENVSVTFDEQTAVRSVNLSIERGQMIAIIGPSGCGKTTLLRTMAGLEFASEGQVRLATSNRGKRGDIGFVFQHPALLPWANALENVMLPLDLIDAGSRQQRREAAMEALRSVQLEQAWNKRPSELSGGMQMRASIARALVTGPEILLLDEPFAALDEMLRTDLGKLLVDLWQEKQFTAVMVTHNIGESILLSRKIAVMRSGNLETVIENPLPWPRDHAQTRTPEFAAFYGQVSDCLRGHGRSGEAAS